MKVNHNDLEWWSARCAGLLNNMLIAEEAVATQDRKYVKELLAEYQKIMYGEPPLTFLDKIKVIAKNISNVMV